MYLEVKTKCKYKERIGSKYEQTVETKLPKYAYTWKEQSNEEMEEQTQEQEQQKETNVSRETSDEKNEVKNMKMQVAVDKINSVTTHDGNRVKIKCINLFHSNGNGIAVFEILGKEYLKLSVTISNQADKNYDDTLIYLCTNWNKIIKIVRNPLLIETTNLEKIKVRLYDENKDKSDFEIRVSRKEVEFKDNRYYINGWESCNIDRLYNYIFYNRSRVMKKAHKMIRKYKKHDIIIPLYLAIKYNAKCEKVYQGTAKNEEEATKEVTKEINQLLNKEEKLIHYSIPYSCYKDHFEDAVKCYDKYVDICEKEYNKETKCMDFVLRIRRKLLEYDNFIFESTYDKIMRCNKVIYRTHLYKLEDELGVEKNATGSYWEKGKKEINAEKEQQIKEILKKTLIIEEYQTIVDVMND